MAWTGTNLPLTLSTDICSCSEDCLELDVSLFPIQNIFKVTVFWDVTVYVYSLLALY
jgi:hypothetical protein